MTEETGYELDEETFALYVEALMLKCAEEGVDPTDTEGVFEVMRRWWYIMNDPDVVSAYMSAVKTAKLMAEKAEYEAGIAAINQQLGV